MHTVIIKHVANSEPERFQDVVNAMARVPTPGSLSVGLGFQFKNMAWSLYFSAGQQFLPAFNPPLFDSGNVTQADGLGSLVAWFCQVEMYLYVKLPRSKAFRTRQVIARCSRLGFSYAVHLAKDRAETKNLPKSFAFDIVHLSLGVPSKFKLSITHEIR
jgi:hypothetical protein